MANYKLSEEAKEDLIRIHHFGFEKFGMKQADKYFYSFFECFEVIAENPFPFESVDHISAGYKKCPCGSDTIYFRCKEIAVEIMAVMGKQDLGNKL